MEHRAGARGRRAAGHPARPSSRHDAPVRARADLGPADDWDRPGDEVELREIIKRVSADSDALDRIGKLLDGSASPAIVVGSAVDRDGAWDEMVALAERFGARVYGAPLSGRCGFPEDHELFGHNLPGSRRAIVQALARHRRGAGRRRRRVHVPRGRRRRSSARRHDLVPVDRR